MANYSRISRFQQRKIIIQSAVLLLFSIAFIILFVFIILPLTARLVDLIPSKSGTPQASNDVLPPQAPILFPILDATNSAQLSIAGYAQADTTVTLLNNDTRVQEMKVGQDGNFSFMDFTLSEGQNKLVVTSKSDDGGESSSPAHIIDLDTTAPSLEVQEPQDGTTVTVRRNQVVTVKGKTDQKTRVFLNDRLLFVDTQGNFNGTFQLADGDNTLKVKAVDAAGNAAEKEIKVAFKP